MCFEQVQRFILAKKIFWGYGHFTPIDSLLYAYAVAKTLNFILSSCFSQNTKAECAKVRAVRAARLFFLAQAI